MTIKYTLDDGAYAPAKAYEADAGFDIRTPVSFSLHTTDCATIDTGIHVQIPEGYVGFLKSKSGLNVKFGISCEGVIDSGYTGSIVAKLYRNDTHARAVTKDFAKGDKITQLVILPIPEVELELVDSIDGERGDNGFGSTGR